MATNRKIAAGRRRPGSGNGAPIGTKTGPEFRAVPSFRPPLVTLDMFALRALADTELGDRFLAALDGHGTVCFSWMDVIEANKVSGPSAARVRGLLDSIGARWVPTDCNPWRVIERERQGLVHPWYCAPLQRAHDQATPSGTGSFSGVLGAIQNADAEAYVKQLGDAVAPLLQMLGLSKLGAIPEIKVPADGTAAERVLESFLRVVQRELAGPPVGTLRTLLSANDVVDLLRACVPLAYCDMVTLDGKWADWAAKAGRLVPARAVAYREVKGFVDAFAAWPPETQARLP